MLLPQKKLIELIEVKFRIRAMKIELSIGRKILDNRVERKPRSLATPTRLSKFIEFSVK